MSVQPEALDELLDELGHTVDRFLGDRSPLSRVRHLIRNHDEPRFDRALWHDEADLGWTGITIPEPLGGTGFDVGAAARLLEMCGRHLVPEPFLSTIALATPVLLSSPTARAEELLSGIASGDLIVAVATPRVFDLANGRSPVMAQSRSTEGYSLEGEATGVLDATDADYVLVPSLTPDGLEWFGVRAQADHLTYTDATLVDGRRASLLTFDGVHVEGADLVCTSGHGHRATDDLLCTGAALVAAHLMGLAERAFDMTLEYLRVRHQFGVPIGSFQALQHRMATLSVELLVARSVVDGAISAIQAGAPDAALLASAAKARSGELACLVTSAGVQYHGGIGMTIEADIGLFFMAARVVDQYGGDQHLHFERAAKLLNL